MNQKMPPPQEASTDCPPYHCPPIARVYSESGTGCRLLLQSGSGDWYRYTIDEAVFRALTGNTALARIGVESLLRASPRNQRALRLSALLGP